MTGVKLALFDDHPLLLDGLEQMFHRTGDYSIVGKGACASDAIEITLSSGAQLVVLDLDMPGNVFDAIQKIKSENPDVKILIFTASTAIDHAVRALEAGANGYVVKGTTACDLAQAIRTVLDGDTYIAQNFVARVITALRESSIRKRNLQAMQLSIREDQIMRLLLRGKTNREIAEELTISEKTVKHYMSILMQKLNVRNRIEAVLAAQKLAPGLMSEIGEVPHYRH
jgi:two-component system, NarL family, nitrate/nitrite response regulator NarL